MDQSWTNIWESVTIQGSPEISNDIFDLNLPRRDVARVNRLGSPFDWTFRFKDWSTLKLFLTSGEERCMVEGLVAVKVAAEDEEGVPKALLEAGILDVVLGIVASLTQDCSLLLRRTSVATLARLLDHELVLERLLSLPDTSCLLPAFCDTEDTITLELLSEVVSVISSRALGCSLLLQCASPEHLVPKLSPNYSDDIVLNCLRSLHNLVRTPKEGCLPELKNIPLASLLDLLNHLEPSIISAAIELLTALTEPPLDPGILGQAVELRVVEHFVRVLEDSNMINLHLGVLKILSNLLASPSILCSTSQRELLPKIFQFLELNETFSIIKAPIVKVIVQLGQTTQGKPLLNERHFLNRLVSYLETQDESLVLVACMGLQVLFKEEADQSSEEILSAVRSLFNVLSKGSRPLSNRIAAAGTLAAMLDVSAVAKEVALSWIDNLVDVLDVPSGPSELLINSVRCLKTLAACPKLADHPPFKRIVSSLVRFIAREEKVENLTLISLQTFSLIAAHRESKPLILELPSIVSILLTRLLDNDCSLPLMWQISNFIHTLVVDDKKTSEQFINLGLIDWLREEDERRKVCPTLELLLKTLLDNNLSLKFSHLNRLESHDVTETGFSVSRCHFKERFECGDPCPLTLSQLMATVASPSSPLYVTLWDQVVSSQPADGMKREDQLKTPHILKKNKTSIKGGTTTVSATTSCEQINYWICQGVIPRDETLIGYLASLKAYCSAKDCSVTEDIARFVYGAMCGQDPQVLVSPTQVAAHLYHIKEQLKTTITPLGSLRYGAKLERAVLFKVLADQMDLPCRLLRSGLHTAWVEVRGPSGSWALVDLMNNIGELLPLESPQAQLYSASNY